jgi:putative tricarboxylic transport membrane protein
MKGEGMAEEAVSGGQNHRWSQALRTIVRIAIPVGGAALGAFYVYSAFSIRLPPLGDVLGPRFFPFALGGLFVACSVLLLLVQGLRAEPSAGAASERAAVVSPQLLAVLAGTIAYAAVLEHLGYILTTYGLFVLFSSVIGRRSLWLSCLLAVPLVAAFYLTFQVWLGIELPAWGE